MKKSFDSVNDEKFIIEIAKNFEIYSPYLKQNVDLGENLRNIFLGLGGIKTIPSNFDDISKKPSILLNYISSFENLAKQKYMKVNLGQGSSKYRVILIGSLNSKKYDRNEKKFKQEITNRQFKSLRTSHKFLMRVREINSKEKDSEVILKNIIDLSRKNEYFKFSTIRSYLIKFFSCIFPDVFLPIFKRSDLKEFCKLLGINPDTKGLNADFETDIKLSYLIKKTLKEKITFNSIDMRKYPSTLQVNFLYRFSRILTNKKYLVLWNNLKGLNFNSFPTDEYSTLVLFLLMLKTEKFNENWEEFGLKNLHKINFLKVSDDYPDLIGYIPEQTDGTPFKMVNIELEYLNSRYKHEQEETPEILKDLYVICWVNNGPGNGISTNDNRVIALRDILEKE